MKQANIRNINNEDAYALADLMAKVGAEHIWIGEASFTPDELRNCSKKNSTVKKCTSSSQKKTKSMTGDKKWECLCKEGPGVQCNKCRCNLICDAAQINQINTATADEYPNCQKHPCDECNNLIDGNCSPECPHFLGNSKDEPKDDGAKNENDLLAQLHAMNDDLIGLSVQMDDLNGKYELLDDDINGVRTEIDCVRRENAKMFSNVAKILNSILDDIIALEGGEGYDDEFPDDLEDTTDYDEYDMSDEDEDEDPPSYAPNGVKLNRYHRDSIRAKLAQIRYRRVHRGETLDPIEEKSDIPAIHVHVHIVKKENE